jgi:WD40 repeat protein
MTGSTRQIQHSKVNARFLQIGWPIRSRYVVWALSSAFGTALFLTLWLLWPLAPKTTIYARLRLHALSPDGSILATSGDYNSRIHQGAICLWDVRTGHEVLSIEGGWSANRHVEFSPRGTMLAVRDEADHLTIWDVSRGNEVARFSELELEAKLPLETRFSPDDRFLILQEPFKEIDDHRFLVFWNLKSKTVQARLRGTLSDLKIAKDGSFIVNACRIGPEHVTVEQWRLDAAFPEFGPLLERDVMASEVAISPRLDAFASRSTNAGPDGDAVQLWDLVTGEETAKAVYRDPDPANSQIQFSPTGTFLTVENSNRFGWIRPKPVSPPLWSTVRSLEPTGANLDPLHISPDDRWILALSKTRGVELYDTSTFSRLATVSVPGDGYSRTIIGLTESPTLADLYNFTPDSKFVLVTGLAGRRTRHVVTDFVDRNLPGYLKPTHGAVTRLWDVQSGQQIVAFYGTLQGLYSSAAKILVTAHEDGTTKIWDMPPRKPVAALFGLSVVSWLVLMLGIGHRPFRKSEKKG